MRAPRLGGLVAALIVAGTAVLAAVPAFADPGTASPQASVGPTPSGGPTPSTTPVSPPDAPAPSEAPPGAAQSPASASPAAEASVTPVPDPDRSLRRRQATTVDTVDDAFRPTRITVDVGATVSWTNSGQNPHTVTADGGSFDSGTIESADTFSRTFSAAGTFAYHCRFHGGPGGSGMSGVVIVLAADTGGTGTTGAGPAEVDDTGDLPATGLDRSAALAASVVLTVVGIASVTLGRRHPRRIG